MATNPPKGPGRRGAVRKRSQTFNPTIERWTKRNTETGRFMDQKQDGKPFKGTEGEVGGGAATGRSEING